MKEYGNGRAKNGSMRNGVIVSGTFSAYAPPSGSRKKVARLTMKAANQTLIPFDNPLPSVTLTTDGACRPNPGRGAWAYVLRFGTACKQRAGCSPHGEITTNNRMELQAIIEGLSALKRPCSVLVRTDSQICAYLLNGKGKKPHKRENQDLVQAVLLLCSKHQVRAEWVRGHAGDPDNETCDWLAESQLL